MARPGTKLPSKHLMNYRKVANLDTEPAEPPEGLSIAQRDLWQLKKENRLEFQKMWDMAERTHAAKKAPTPSTSFGKSQTGTENGASATGSNDPGTQRALELIDRFLEDWKKGVRE